MKKHATRTLLTLLLVLCMILPQTVMAAVPKGATCYIQVTIEDDKEGNKVTDTSSKYLTGAAPLTGEVVTLVQKNHDAMKVFGSPAMRAIMDEGLEAFRSAEDGAWNAYVDQYFADVTGTSLKNLLKAKTSTMNDLTPNTIYKMTFKNEVAGDAKYGTTYTVTLVMYTQGGTAAVLP